MIIDKIVKSIIITSLAVCGIFADGPMGPDRPSSLKKSMPPKDFKSDLSIGDDIDYDSSASRVKEYEISGVEDEEFGYINIGGLKVGQSGIVVNKNNSPVIIAIASVVESNPSRSKIEFKEYSDLEQDAIPTSNLKVNNGDIFILNYLYNSSILLAPNSESFTMVRKQLSDFDFLHPDIFASFLKVEEVPIPSKEVLQKFAIAQNLGSIVIVIDNIAYQVDSRTFKVVDQFDVNYNDKGSMKPFYTRVEEIEGGTFDFGADTIGEYTKYYKKLLDLK